MSYSHIQPGTRVVSKFGVGTVRLLDQEGRRAEVILDEPIRSDGDRSYWASLRNLSLESEWPKSWRWQLAALCFGATLVIAVVFFGVTSFVESDLFQRLASGTGESEIPVWEYLFAVSILPAMLFLFCRD